MKKVFLSVIIIAKNEEERIGRCLESVVKLKKKYSTEIIFVDSASTDKTISIVSKYPVQIYQLNQSKYLNPSAGRYIGFPKSKGEYIFFIDGDSILIDGFIEKALKVLQDPKIAAVGGRRLFRITNESLKIREHMTGKSKVGKTIGGTGLYKRKVLQEAGAFNPYMGGQEERELCFRIRNKGYKIINADFPMEFHINKEMDIHEASERAGYFIGVGQIIRKYGLRKITWELLFAQRKALLETLAIVFAMVWLIISVFVHLLPLIIGSSIIIFGILILVAYKGPKKIYVFFASRIKLFISILKGLMKGIHKSESFDKLVKVKKLK